MLAHDELRGRRAASPELLAAVRAASADGPRGDPALARGGPQRAATGGASAATKMKSTMP